MLLILREDFPKLLFFMRRNVWTANPHEAKHYKDGDKAQNACDALKDKFKGIPVKFCHVDDLVKSDGRWGFVE